jgi:hypothetical protein
LGIVVVGAVCSSSFLTSLSSIGFYESLAATLVTSFGISVSSLVTKVTVVFYEKVNTSVLTILPLITHSYFLSAAAGYTSSDWGSDSFS